MNITLVKPALSGLLLVAALSIACSTVSAFDKGSLVQKKCIVCHSAENGKLARVEDVRTTPEEWTVIVDRMRRLHGMKIKAGEMAILLKELCATQILSPEEAAQVSYINLFNNPQTTEAPDGADEERLFAACVRCHSSAKIHSYRMTESAWAKVRDFMIYIDPAIMFQMREMHWRTEADRVLQELAQKLPYKQAWTAPEAKPDGEWLVLGVESGRGSYRGKATLKSEGNDEYSLQGVLNFSDGTIESFSGEGTLYGGYALRTRTSHNGSSTMGAFSFVDGIISGEHHHNGPNFRTSSSTWYPIIKNSQALRITPAYLLGDEETKILIEGINLPQLTAKDISVSDSQVEVLQATTSSPETIEVLLVYRGSGHGNASVSVKGLASGSNSLALKLAPRIDYLSLSPATGRARVNGGINYPAEGVQFQALAWSRGADADKPSDDILLGPVAAEFSLAEEISRPGDDDLVYMGVIEANGTYLPIGDYQPIPAREYGGEGTGMVKVIAKYTRGEVPYSAEGRLVVTVPDYIQRLK
jgi:quinohemoprotein amine dehydrogenase